MQKNKLYLKNDSVIRGLEERDGKILVIDCMRRTMPQWKKKASLDGWEQCSQETLYAITNIEVPEIDSLCPESRKKAYEQYTMIAPILRLLSDEQKKCEMISLIAANEKISKQTVRKYLCLYLSFQDIAILAPKDKESNTCLSKDEKNMRWGLNKYYFSYQKHSLKTAYTLMLKAKYCDGNGDLVAEYPTFHQFRYFYRKRKNRQMILSILVDTFISKISLTMQPGPKIDSISGA